MAEINQGEIAGPRIPDRAIRDGYNEITHTNQLMLGCLLKPGEDTRTMASRADIH